MDIVRRTMDTNHVRAPRFRYEVNNSYLILNAGGQRGGERLHSSTFVIVSEMGHHAVYTYPT
jgi:hypothetical protein